MVFSTIIFIVSWLSFILFADKKKFFIFSPTCYVAIILGFATDLLIHYYPLWDYPAQKDLHCIFRYYLDDVGIYFVTTYLFLQTLPKNQKLSRVALHIFLWSLLSIAIEAIALLTNSMIHDMWWTPYYSYIADWILFILFYSHYRFRAKHTQMI